MISALALCSVFKGPTAPLAEISEKYFGLSPEEASRKAARHELPVPAFRLRESQKAPLVVSCQALGDYIDQVEAQARERWAHAQP